MNPISIKHVEIFKAGTFKDDKGRTHSFNEADLDAIVAKYNSKNHTAPCVIGHPEATAPAFGWLESVKREGSRLYADLKDMVPEFVDTLKSGLFKKRSLSLYGDGSIRHLGFLGAVPPAIKGLADINFSEKNSSDKDSITFDFSEEATASSFRAVGRLLSKLRDYLIESIGLEKADNVLSPWEVDWLKETQADAGNNHSFSEHQPDGGSMDLQKALARIIELENEINSLKSQAASFSDQVKKIPALEAAQTELATLKAKVAKDEAAQRTKDFSEFVDKHIKAGRIAPVLRKVNIDNLERAHLAGVNVSFSEGTKTPLQELQEAIEAAPVIVQFAEQATRDNAGNQENAQTETPEASRARALKYQDAQAKAGKSINFSEALQAINAGLDK